MEKSINEKVKELYDMGFDKDIIMTSVGISQEDYDTILSENNNPKKENKSKSNAKNQQKSKLQFVRERYYSLYNKVDSTPKSKEPTLSQEDRKIVLDIIGEIENEFKDVKQHATINFATVNQKFFSKFDRLDKYKLPFDLMEKAYLAFPEECLVYSFRNKNRSVRSKIYSKRMEYQRKYVDAISRKADNVETIEELEGLLKKVYSNLSSANYMIRSTIQSKIMRKIFEEKQKMYTSSSTVPESSKKIAEYAMSEECDDDKLDNLIEEEAGIQFETKREALAKKGLSKSTIDIRMPNKETAKNIVIYQITKTIRDGGYISNPDKILRRVSRISENSESAYEVILGNLIATERYDDACEFVNRHIYKTDSREKLVKKRNCLMRIKKAEISNFIMRGIEAKEGNFQEENKYYDMIEQGIEKAKISPNSIELGMSKDGSKKITWDDVMEKNKKKANASREI